MSSGIDWTSEAVAPEKEAVAVTPQPTTDWTNQALNIDEDQSAPRMLDVPPVRPLPGPCSMCTGASRVPTTALDGQTTVRYDGRS